MSGPSPLLRSASATREVVAPLVWLLAGLFVSYVYLLGALPFDWLAAPLPFFPPQAIILSVLLLTPPRRWWIYLGVYYVAQVFQGIVLHNLPPGYALLSNVANVIEPLVGAALFRRFVPRSDQFTTLQSVATYVGCVAIASVIGATWGATIRALFGSAFWLSWQGWFLADVLASLVLAPTIVLWSRVEPGSISGASPARKLEAVVAGLGLLGVGLLVFGTRPEDLDRAPALLYLPVPMLVWIAVRFGPRGLMSALSLVTVLAIAGASNDLGPFVGRSTSANIFTIQLFLLGIGVPLFCLAALVQERQRGENQLRQSEERYRAVVTNFPRGAVFLFGPDLRHLFADGQGVAEIAAGFSMMPIAGLTVWEAFPPALAAELEPRYRAALAGEHASFELVHMGRTYQGHALPVRYAGGANGMVVMQDVTEERRAEVLAKLDRAKTEFFNNVSHELRTPLTLLLGPLEQVLADRASGLSERARAELTLAHRNAVRLLNLVNALLHFARVDAGRLDPIYVPTDLGTCTAELASLFRSAIENAGLRFVVDCPAQDEPIYIDREQWEHIVLNLLSNALKFTLSGEIGVRTRLVGEDALLTVWDTGDGIPQDELPLVFERFHRGRRNHARTTEGTGIGLALVKELVRLHGGTIEVASTIGVGSTFTVRVLRGVAHLPPDRIGVSYHLGRGQASSPYVEEARRWLDDVTQSAETETGTLAPNAPRLLIADDNADMRSYLVRLLEQRGTVRAVGDGPTALEVARAWEPDLILADVMMPGLDGIRLVEIVRNDPRLRATSVILLSARSGDEARIDGLRAGADEYLEKPFSAAELLARIDSQLALVRMRGESRAEEERERLARELHDSVSQALFAAKVTADALPHMLERDRGGADEALLELQRMTAAAQAEMRSLLLELRPDALTRAPFHELLDTLVTATAVKNHIAVDARLDSVPPLQPDVQVALYRIAQEAMTNVTKHAAANRISVRLAVEERPNAGAPVIGIRLQVTDDGRGFDVAQPPRGRIGLTSMRERAKAIGATLSIESQIARGTTVTATWEGTATPVEWRVSPAAKGVHTAANTEPAEPLGAPLDRSAKG